MDREKVIGHLGILRTWCAVNPKYGMALSVEDCDKAVGWLDDAISLLKAQEPGVIKNSAGNGICPGCGHIIPAWSSPNYCGYCGQAVKWE